MAWRVWTLGWMNGGGEAGEGGGGEKSRRIMQMREDKGRTVGETCGWVDGDVNVCVRLEFGIASSPAIGVSNIGLIRFTELFFIRGLERASRLFLSASLFGGRFAHHHPVLPLSKVFSNRSIRYSCKRGMCRLLAG